jgi:hypothetical protein
MKEIYEKAALINIWLGRANESTLLVWSRISDVVEKIFIRYFEEYQMNMDDMIERKLDEIVAIFKIPSGELDMEVLIGLKDILTRRWWRRAWIVQECSVIDVLTIICCGSDSAVWQIFISAIIMIHKALELAAAEKSVLHDIVASVLWVYSIDLLRVMLMCDGLPLLTINVQLYRVLEMMRGYNASRPGLCIPCDDKR